MNKMTAYCGLNCENCDARKATVNNDDALREKTAGLWTELNGVEITKDMINCLGCRMDGVKTPFCESLCEIRRCAMEKGFETCGDCAKLTECETVSMIISDNQEALNNLKRMTLTSPSFADNAVIPKKHTGFGEDISPELVICNAPDDTISYAVILDDLDVPFTKSFNHWLIWNIPKTDVIPEGLPFGAVMKNPISAVQGKAWGRHGYRGPKQPLFIRNEHRYVFTVYALNVMLDISPDSDKKKLLSAMDGHILASDSLTGKYKR